MLDSPDERAPQPSFISKASIALNRWKTVLNARPGKVTPQTPLTGKLGEIVRCLEASKDVSLHDLTTLTGWKQATVRGALSRLRARGYVIRRKIRDGTALYHLERR